MVAHEVTLYSIHTAQNVAESLVAFQARGEDEYYVMTVVETDEKGDESHLDTINLRLRGKTTLADQFEILDCITDTGKRVSVEVGITGLRPEHARIRVEH